MQATCDAQLLVPPPVPLSSCGRIQPAKQTATTREESQVSRGSLTFTFFPLEVVYPFYFNSPRRVGREESHSDWLSTTLVQVVKTISTLGTWNWSLLKTLHSSPWAVAVGTLMVLGNKSQAGQSWSATPCRQFKARAMHVTGSSDVWALSLQVNLLPTAKGLVSCQGAPRPTPSGHPEIQLHTLPSSLPSMTMRFISTLWRKRHFSFSPLAERNLRMQLYVTHVVYACDSCSHEEFLRLFCFHTFVFQL